MKKNKKPSLLEIISQHEEDGLPLNTLSYNEFKKARELEKDGFINKIMKKDDEGEYFVYVINKKRIK